jgi:hypothetical protein
LNNASILLLWTTGSGNDYSIDYAFEVDVGKRKSVAGLKRKNPFVMSTTTPSGSSHKEKRTDLDHDYIMNTDWHIGVVQVAPLPHQASADLRLNLTSAASISQSAVASGSNSGESLDIRTAAEGPQSLSTAKGKRAPSTDPTSPHTAPPSKRPKYAIGSKQFTRVTRHHVYWQLDGDVIVQIGDVGFKLRKSRLVKMSTWFRDILESRNEADDAVEPHMFIHDDTGTHAFIDLEKTMVTVEDFEILLDALDNAM